MRGARAFARGVRLEFLGWGQAWAVPVLIFVGVWNAFGNMLPGVGFWPTTVHAVILSGILTSCGMAGLAAWAGAREHRLGLRPLRELALRPGWWLPGAQLAALWLWAAVVHAAVALAAAARTVLTGATGDLSPAGLLTGGLGVLVWTTAGFALGRALPSRFTPPLAAVLPFGLYVLGYELAGRTVYLLSPYLDELVDPYGVPAAGLYASQAVWLLGVLGLVACLVLLGAVRGVLRPAGAMVPAAAAAAAGVLLLTAFEGKLHAPSDDTADSASLATACREAGGLSICVHPAYRTALAGLHDVFTEELRGRLDGTPGAVDRLVQREQGHTGTPASIHLTSLRAGWQHEVESDFLASLVDGTVCIRGDMESGALTDLTAQWIAGGRAEAASLPGFSEPTDAMNRAERFLNSAPPREVNRWLAGHWNPFRTCALTGSDFPAR